MAVQEVSVAELYEAHINQGGAVLIDVRTHAEFEGQHIPGSKCIPLDQLSREIVAEHQKHPDEPIYIICRSGNRSGMAVRKLMESDFQKALSVSERDNEEPWIDEKSQQRSESSQRPGGNSHLPVEGDDFSLTGLDRIPRFLPGKYSAGD